MSFNHNHFLSTYYFSLFLFQWITYFFILNLVKKLDWKENLIASSLHSLPEFSVAAISHFRIYIVTTVYCQKICLILLVPNGLLGVKGAMMILYVHDGFLRSITNSSEMLLSIKKKCHILKCLF